MSLVAILLAICLISEVGTSAAFISKPCGKRRLSIRACLEDRRQATARLVWGMSASMSKLSDCDFSSVSVQQPSNLSYIRWGIVGVGDVVSIKSGPPFFLAQNSKLVAVMRRTPGAAAAWAAKFVPPEMGCRGYDTLQEFLSDPEVDAVYIATPPAAHLEVANQVAKAGKACYVEKPVGRCAWETRAIHKAFADRNLPLFTAYVSRSFERTQAIRRLLSEGAIGDRVNRIHYTLRGSDIARGLDWSHGTPWRLEAQQSGGGLVMDVGCHVVDRIDFICGPIVNVLGSASISATGREQQDVEDFVHLKGVIGPSSWASIPSEGATVECTWDFSSTNSLDELVLSGPVGSLVMAAMSPYLPIRVLGPKGDVRQELAFEQPVYTAQPLIQTITNELLHLKGEKSPSRGDNAARTSGILDAALSSYYGGRHDDFWLRKESWPGRNVKQTLVS